MKRFGILFTILGFAVSAGAVTFTTNTSIATGNTLYENQDIVVDACTLTVDGQHAFKSLRVINGGIVTHSANSAPGLYLSITNTVLVDFISKIDASGKGYAANGGPGKGGNSGTYGSGGGYGGLGADSWDPVVGGLTYGSIPEPIHFGSGGGKKSGTGGGAGGGAIRLTVGGTLTVEGEVASNGAVASAYSGGGSGGSVYLTVGALKGAGVISANGGNGDSYAGAGGGGRIAIHYGTMDFWGNLYAHAGSAYYVGGAGTIFQKSAAESFGHLLVDNWHLDGKTTPITQTDTFADITVISFGKLDLSIPDILTVTKALIIEDKGFVLVHCQQALPNIHIKSGGVLGHLPMKSGFDMIVTEDLVVDSGGAVSATGKGYPAGTGPGKGGTGTTYGAGGGYGGKGGNSWNSGSIGGNTYGQPDDPTYFGSGGGNTKGGAGGGTILLTVFGTATIDGEISANGAAATSYGGGGSGGSLFLKLNHLDGAGVVSADGGNGDNYAGGGGGGRIALCAGQNDFLGVITTHGGRNPQNDPLYIGQEGTLHSCQFTFGCGDVLHPYPVADLNRDCRVNLLDVAILAEHWLECSAPGC